MLNYINLTFNKIYQNSKTAVSIFMSFSDQELTYGIKTSHTELKSSKKRWLQKSKHDAVHDSLQFERTYYSPYV